MQRAVVLANIPHFHTNICCTIVTNAQCVNKMFQLYFHRCCQSRQQCWQNHCQARVHFMHFFKLRIRTRKLTRLKPTLWYHIWTWLHLGRLTFCFSHRFRYSIALLCFKAISINGHDVICTDRISGARLWIVTEHYFLTTPANYRQQSAGKLGIY